MEVVEACSEVTGGEIEAVPGGREPWEPAVLVGAYDSAEATFGWRPDRGTLHTILTDAWRWHSAHPQGVRAGVTLRVSGSEAPAGSTLAEERRVQ